MVKHDFQIQSATNIKEIVDCVEEGTYGESPAFLINFFDSLPDSPAMDYLRTMCIPFLFHDFEKNVESSREAVAGFSSTLITLKEKTEKLLQTDSWQVLVSGALENATYVNFGKEVKELTGQHYGTLFKAFDAISYFEEAKKLLLDRLSRNSIEFHDLTDKKLLDQGCGGGRYTAAWKLLGTGHCTGLDFSEIGLEDARLRANQAGFSNIEFIKGSVLEMPFDDESFDIVYSNGVLHHTEDWKKGISEQLRVLRSGGWGWQYLIEKPGGIFWDQIEILRAIMKNVPKTFAQQVMRGMGIPANRIFYMLDHVMVPINTRLTEEELYQELEKNGSIGIKRLTRGTDFDRVEAIYRNVPYAKEKFGIGENRFVFSKKS